MLDLTLCGHDLTTKVAWRNRHYPHNAFIYMLGEGLHIALHILQHRACMPLQRQLGEGWVVSAMATRIMHTAPLEIHSNLVTVRLSLLFECRWYAVPASLLASIREVLRHECSPS